MAVPIELEACCTRGSANLFGVVEAAVAVAGGDAEKQRRPLRLAVEETAALAARLGRRRGRLHPRTRR